jgi:hypothetical protein
MSDPTPHTHHSDDARADEAPPTDAVTDEVREEAAQAESGDPEEFPGESALTHP